ncbi:MAG: hypothetical protein QXI16_07095 [Sulfolobaceae archaeon]
MKKKILSALLLINILMFMCLSLSVGAELINDVISQYNIKREYPTTIMFPGDKKATYYLIYQHDGEYYYNKAFYKNNESPLINYGGSGFIATGNVGTCIIHNINMSNMFDITFTVNEDTVVYNPTSLILVRFNDNKNFIIKNSSELSDYNLVGHFFLYQDRSDDLPQDLVYYFANYDGELDFTSSITEARFTSLGDYVNVSSNNIKSFFTSNYVAKKTSTSDGTRLNFNELFGVGSYVETSYYLPTDISIPSYFIPNKSVTNEVSFRFTNRDVNNLKIVVSRYTNVSDKVATPDTGIFSFSRSVFANYMHQYITFQPESFKDIPKDKVLHYKFDMSGLVSLISQNKTYTDYWGNTAYFYDLFGLVIDETYKAEAFVLELYGDDKLLTSATYCYTGSKRFDEPTGEPYVEFLIKDKDDGFEPIIDDDNEKIGGFDDSEKDDTVIKNPVGDYDLNFNIDDIGLAVMSSVNSTKSLFTFAWSLFPAAFMTLLLGALGLIVILRVLGR